jgi:hypothetical protein
MAQSALTAVFKRAFMVSSKLKFETTSQREKLMKIS